MEKERRLKLTTKNLTNTATKYVVGKLVTPWEITILRNCLDSFSRC